MFTICLFIFWLDTVVLCKTRKLQNTNRVNFSVFCSSCRDIIDTSLQPFTVLIKSNLADIIILWLLKLRYYNANSEPRRYRIRHLTPMFIGTPCTQEKKYSYKVVFLFSGYHCIIQLLQNLNVYLNIDLKNNLNKGLLES